VPDLEWVRGMPCLEAIALENLPRVSSLEALAALTGLRALGVEGSMWTSMQVDSLAPLQWLRHLEYLFLTNLRVRDGSLAALHGLASLRVLQCARYFGDNAFAELAAARPELSCRWFDRRSKADTRA